MQMFGISLRFSDCQICISCHTLGLGIVTRVKLSHCWRSAGNSSETLRLAPCHGIVNLIVT